VVLADLAHAGLATHLTLGPLVGADGERLLDALLREVGPVDPTLRAQLLQRAGGVPFFAVSCVRALRPGVQEPVALPWDLRHSIRQRVAALAVEAQEVLGVAAVIGRRVAPGLLTAVAARPREVVLAALEAAGRAQLLVEEPDAAAYQFPHDVIREVLEADVGVARRADLHRRVALALEEQSAPPCDPAQARPSLPVRHRVVAGARGSTRRSWTERQRWALEHLRTAGPLSPRAYATALSVSVDTALRDLQELVDQGLVQPAGTTRDRCYVLAGDAAVSAIRRTPP
jgi:hypothetical protein